jgi:adenylate cyclase
MSAVVSPIRIPEQEPWVANDLVEWLLLEGWTLPDTKTLVAELGRRMRRGGIPIDRIRVNIRTLHPAVFGFGTGWNADSDEITEVSVPHGIRETEMYRRSPYWPLFEEGAAAIRRRLDIAQPLLDFPILADLRDDGYTDYVALPIEFSGGRRNALALASRKAGGFSSHHLKLIYDTLPALARVLETFHLRLTASTLMDTYIGKLAGARVLDGQIQRGAVESVDAVIWYCDLRGSSKLAESMPPTAFLALLNDYFDAMAGAVLDNGGEVLRFIGDAMLAIFPLKPAAVEVSTELDLLAGGVCGSSFNSGLCAAHDAHERMDKLNATRVAAGLEPLGFGIALHAGNVLYGNVGTDTRLEFTVTGAAANYAARVEGYCKILGESLLVSTEFARLFPFNYVSLGLHHFKGYDTPQELLTVVCPEPARQEVVEHAAMVG